MTKARKPTTDAVAILHQRYIEGKPEMAALLEQERINADVARKVYDLRIAAALTQQQLAERVGTKPSVISRLEDADYEGHSLTMLQRIAAAVGKRVEVNFLPAEPSPRQVAEGAQMSGTARKRRTAGTPAKTSKREDARSAR